MAKRRRAKAETEEEREKTVERKVLFYRADCGSNEAGELDRFSPQKAFEHIQGLPYTIDGRYLPTAEDEEYICCVVDRNDNRPQIRLWTTRRANLPLVDNSGKLSQIPIPAAAGLAEPSHMVFFPNNIVGVEFNFYAPRISRLTTYLTRKGNGYCPTVTFMPLLNQETQEQLNHVGELKLFSLRVRKSFADIIAQADESLGMAFKAAAGAITTGEVEVLLRVPRGTEGALPHKLLNVARKLMGLDGIRENASEFRVHGFSTDHPGMAYLDLLNDRLLQKKKIVVEDKRTRALNSKSAFAAIEQAYDELRPQLLKAAGIKI